MSRHSANDDGRGLPPLKDAVTLCTITMKAGDTLWHSTMPVIE